MSLVRRSSTLFLILGALMAFCNILPLAIFLLWLGFIQVFNALAIGLPFERAVHWLHAMTFEPLACFGVFVLRFCPLKESHVGDKQPILLVHGYGDHKNVWVVQKKRLENLGLGPIYTIDFGNPFRSIHHYAEKLKDKVEFIAKETNRSDLTLIGHSMGGLVCSLYATKLAPGNTVTDLITIASPLLGTPLAKIAIGDDAREMEPDSDFIKNLRQAMQENRSTRFYHIATKCDQIVIPGDTAATLDHEHVIYKDLGHVSLLYSGRVAKQIHKWLT
ncbi:MAG: hypothetical protein COT85_01625 [Chlamydiae bacterium CG10_big_fil_rev_8_21_14_0_10_42_34]|nr:MAG: hypothetical protein COT85_01625 [Chlamydiae bacterium CG10_big_fil_rev_8_21_14_0_10_42_34]